MSAENEKFVADFCQAWASKKADEMLGDLTEDCC
jgi:hypothetical protein